MATGQEMDRDTGKVNWVRGPHGSHSNSMGVERNQDTGSRKLEGSGMAMWEGARRGRDSQ